MDWLAEFNDVGADGVKDTHDAGEGDGIPTEGEPNFDRTDLNESDQIGLTGFKYNKIKAGQGNPVADADGIVFYTDTQAWPEKLYRKWVSPTRPRFASIRRSSTTTTSGSCSPPGRSDSRRARPSDSPWRWRMGRT
jgi:hypothetical protein